MFSEVAITSEAYVKAWIYSPNYAETSMTAVSEIKATSHKVSDAALSLLSFSYEKAKLTVDVFMEGKVFSEAYCNATVYLPSLKKKQTGTVFLKVMLFGKAVLS